MTTVISTDGLRPADGEAFWRCAMSETFVSCDIGEVTDGPFGGTIEANWIGPMMLARVTATGQDIHRTPRHIASAAAEFFQVAVVTDGVGWLDQDGRQTELYPGDCVVYETNRPFNWFFSSDWDVSVFSFPGAAVPLPESNRPHLTSRRLDGHSAITKVTSRFLLDLARISDNIPAAHAPRMMGHASDLVLTMLADQLGEPSGRGPAQRTLMLRIKDYVDRHHRNPALGPHEIAASVNISTRYLHKLFSSEAGSVSQYVREVRLTGCRRDLLDLRLADRPIAAIAYGRGFGDLSGFNRAFREAYGMTPTELRNKTSGPELR